EQTWPKSSRHFRQIGFSQTRQRCVAGWPGCLAQNSRAAVSAAAAVLEARLPRRDVPAGGAPAGVGAAINGGGASTGAAAASSCRINSFTRSDESSPQFWHTNRIGVCPISGVMSKEYFAPHEH